MSKAANLPAPVKQSRLVFVLLRVFFATVVLLFVFTDLTMPATIEISDYAATFYTPGKLIRTGRLNELYPSPKDTRLADTAYNKAAHSFLPHLPAAMGTACSYPPFVALLISPLTVLPPALSLLAFQILSLSAFAASVFLLAGCDWARTDRALFSAILFTPLLVVVWIGQLDIVAAILPYACMYHLLTKNKSYLAGLVASLSLMKPQLALVPFFVATVLLSKRQWRMFAGLASGASLFALITVVVFGPEVCGGWLVAMKLQEADFLSPTSGVPRHLTVSIPRFVLFMVPLSQVSSFRPVVYGLAALLLVTALLVCCRFARAYQDDSDVLKMTIVVACLAIPVVAPHLLYYDLSVLAVAGILVCAYDWSDTSFSTYLRPRALNLWIVISIYPFIFALSQSMYLPLVILVSAAIVFAGVIRLVWQKIQEFPGARVAGSST